MAGYVYYGSCVEPGGFELDDVTCNDICPQCQSNEAVYRYWETNDGGCINRHWRVRCPACGHADSDPFVDDDQMIPDLHLAGDGDDQAAVP